MVVNVYRSGTFEVVDASTLFLHTDYAVMHSEDTCNESGNYDKSIPLEDETLIWEAGVEESGDPVVYIRGPETTPSAFHHPD